jgi:hypothetical protein
VFLLAAVVVARADPPGAAVTTVPTGAPGQALAFLQSTAAEASHVFKTTPGNLYAFGATSSASAGYILLIDSTTVPNDGALTSCGTTNVAGCLKWCAPIPSGSAASVFAGFQLSPGPPMPFVNGVVAVFSSTGCSTKTLGATSVFFEAQVY